MHGGGVQHTSTHFCSLSAADSTSAASRLQRPAPRHPSGSRFGTTTALWVRFIWPASRNIHFPGVASRQTQLARNCSCGRIPFHQTDSLFILQPDRQTDRQRITTLGILQVFHPSSPLSVASGRAYYMMHTYIWREGKRDSVTRFLPPICLGNNPLLD